MVSKVAELYIPSSVQRVLNTYLPYSRTNQLAIVTLGLFAVALSVVYCARYFASRVSQSALSNGFPDELNKVFGGVSEVNKLSPISPNFFHAIQFSTVDPFKALKAINRIIAQHGFLAPIMRGIDAQGEQFIVLSHKSAEKKDLELEQHIVYEAKHQDNKQWMFGTVIYKHSERGPVPQIVAFEKYKPEHNDLLQQLVHNIDSRVNNLLSPPQGVKHTLPSDMGFPEVAINLMGGKKRFDTLPIVYNLSSASPHTSIYHSNDVLNTITKMCNQFGKAPIPPVSIGIDPWGNPFIRMRIFSKETVKEPQFLLIYAVKISEQLEWYLCAEPLSLQHQYKRLIEDLIQDRDTRFQLV